MQQQRRNAESNEHFARRNHNLNRGQPYIEYTRNAEENDLSHLNNSGIMQPGKEIKRAVARKSTTTARRNDPRASKPDPNRYLFFKFRWIFFVNTFVFFCSF